MSESECFRSGAMFLDQFGRETEGRQKNVYYFHTIYGNDKLDIFTVKSLPQHIEKDLYAMSVSELTSRSSYLKGHCLMKI